MSDNNESANAPFLMMMGIGALALFQSVQIYSM